MAKSGFTDSPEFSESIARALKDGWQVIDVQPSGEAAEAAGEHRLGRLRQSFQVGFYATESGEIKPLSEKSVVAIFEFEQGFLRQQAALPPEVIRWDEIAAVLQDASAGYMRGRYLATTFHFTFIRHEGIPAKITVSHREQARLQRAYPETPGGHRAGKFPVPSRSRTVSKIPNFQLFMTLASELRESSAG